MESPPSTWRLCLDYAALSDVGRRRANNQDSFAVVPADDQTVFDQRGHFFMVADGMGAHAAGELASKMAVDTVAMVYRKRLEQPPPEAILSALIDANRHIYSRGLASPDFRGMGTTATAMVLLPSGAMVAHVGDSRAYRLHGTRLEQLTFDHSLVWEIRAAGSSPDAELPSHISKNIITRSLGPNHVVQVDLEGPFIAEDGDTFLLCSDGLSGQVKDDEIGMILGCLPPAEAAQALVDMANLRGGPDNITVVVVRVLGPQIAQESATEMPVTSLPAARPSHPLAWTTAVIAALAALGMLSVGHALLALFAIVVAAGSLILAMWPMVSNTNGQGYQELRRFGRGPYVTCDCTVNPDLLARLAESVQYLREEACNDPRGVDTHDGERLFNRATSATNPTDAARDYLRAMSELMAKTRQAANANPLA